MCAGTVSRTTQLQTVILQAQSTLNLDSFQHYLACHPDRQWSQSLLQGIHKGMDIGFQGDRETVWSGNWKPAVDNRISGQCNYLAAEVALGRKAGLFNQPLFSTYMSGHQWMHSYQEMLGLCQVPHCPWSVMASWGQGQWSHQSRPLPLHLCFLWSSSFPH